MMDRRVASPVDKPHGHMTAILCTCMVELAVRIPDLLTRTSRSELERPRQRALLDQSRMSAALPPDISCKSVDHDVFVASEEHWSWPRPHGIEVRVSSRMVDLREGSLSD